MKKSVKLLAGTGLILSLGLLPGCEPRRMIETLYGPPPAAETAAPGAGFAPWATEEVQDVYGPPPIEKEQPDSRAEEEAEPAAPPGEQP